MRLPRRDNIKHRIEFSNPGDEFFFIVPFLSSYRLSSNHYGTKYYNCIRFIKENIEENNFQLENIFGPLYNKNAI